MSVLWVKRHAAELQRGIMLACATPALYLLWALHRGELGSMPLTTLLEVTGRSALVILTVTLTITPLRRLLSVVATAAQWRRGKRLCDWNWLIKFRRPLGLWSFTYASLHAWIFVAFDLNYDWAAGWEELQDKAFLLSGFIAWALLVPLAVTSANSLRRRLGKHWNTLHALVYLIALLSLLHFWQLTKHGSYTPWPDTAALCALLLYRVLLKVGVIAHWDGDDGTESRVRLPGLRKPPRALQHPH
ncbi:MAG: sulfoxide reductase heme-binding subunit YedZ [Rhodoferax sp.]|nr:sulfoxide reductase heme-binding subunit YedZ [Rhodoferax sp.]